MRKGNGIRCIAIDVPIQGINAINSGPFYHYWIDVSVVL